MLNIKSVIGYVTASVVLCAAAFQASAVPLVPGQLTNGVAEVDPAPGSVLVFSTNAIFSSGSFSGTLFSSVYSNDLSNNFGGLTFTYEFDIDAISPDSASSITIGSLGGGFTGYFTDVSYQTGVGIAPYDVSRSPVGSGNGRNITFTFAGNGYVQPGQISDVLVIQTSASDWAIGNASLQDDVATPNILTLIPISINSVPEPTVMGLFFFGIAGLAYQKRMNRSKNKKQISLPHPSREL